jgi:hypothetical protein
MYRSMAGAAAALVVGVAAAVLGGRS